MSEDHRTFAFPFGRDVDTLVVCRSDLHRRQVIEALGIRAQYELIGSALTGARFKRVIVIRGSDELWSPVEVEQFATMLREYWPTKLERGGEIIVL